MENLDEFANAKNQLRNAVKRFWEACQLPEVELDEDGFMDDIKDIIFDETAIKLE